MVTYDGHFYVKYVNDENSYKKLCWHSPKYCFRGHLDLNLFKKSFKFILNFIFFGAISHLGPAKPFRHKQWQYPNIDVGIRIVPPLKHFPLHNINAGMADTEFLVNSCDRRITEINKNEWTVKCFMLF